MELRFTVWQFVRLMVHLEEQARPSPAAAALLEAWQEVWTPLDQELTRLAESDMGAYSDMMMDQDVVIEDATPDQAATAASALETVMADMDAAIARGGEEDLLQSLKFERRELRQLARRIGRLAEA